MDFLVRILSVILAMDISQDCAVATQAEIHSVIVCAGMTVNQTQQQPCPLGTVINITSIIMRVTQGDTTCTDNPSTVTCERPLESISNNDLKTWKEECNGKIACDSKTRVASLTTTQCDTTSNVVHLNTMEIYYQCVPLKFGTYVGVTRVGGVLDDFSCPDGYNHIDITDMYYTDNTQTGTCQTSDISYTCGVSVELYNNNFRQEVIDACNGQRACSKEITAEPANNSSCSTAYVLILYRCQTESRYTHRCDGYTFDLSCPGNDVLRIISVGFGDTEATLTTEQCQGAAVSNACYSGLQNSHTREIHEECEDKNSCSPTADTSGTMGHCYSNRQIQFVQVAYACRLGYVPEVMTSPSTLGGSTDNVYTITTGNSQQGGGSEPQEAESTTISRDYTSWQTTVSESIAASSQGEPTDTLIIAVSAGAGAVLVLLIIVVTVVCLRRRRRKRASRSGPASTEPHGRGQNEYDLEPTVTRHYMNGSNHSDVMSQPGHVSPCVVFEGQQGLNSQPTAEESLADGYSLATEGQSVSPTRGAVENGDPSTAATYAMPNRAGRINGHVAGETIGADVTSDVTRPDYDEEDTVVVENSLYGSGNGHQR